MKPIYVNYTCYKYCKQNEKVLRSIEEYLECKEHEKADTKIVFHVCQKKIDAHVTIYMLGNMTHVKSDLKISVFLGTGNAQRYVNVNKIYDFVGAHVCASLSGFLVSP